MSHSENSSSGLHMHPRLVLSFLCHDQISNKIFARPRAEKLQHADHNAGDHLMKLEMKLQFWGRCWVRYGDDGGCDDCSVGARVAGRRVIITPTEKLCDTLPCCMECVIK